MDSALKANRVLIFNKLRNKLLKSDVDFCNSLWETNNIYLSSYLTKKYIYNNQLPIIELIDILEAFFLIRINGNYFYLSCGDAIKLYFPIQLKLRKYFIDSNVIDLENVLCHCNNDIDINKFKQIVDSFFDLSNYYLTSVKTFPNIYMFECSQELKNIIKNTNIDGFYDPVLNNIYLTKDIEMFNHELIHSITNNWKGWPNILISEGIAESYNDEFDDMTYERYKHYNKNISRLFISKDICCYDYKLLGLFMKFIISNLGIEKLKKIYYASTFLNNIEAIEVVFNKDIGSINDLFSIWLTLNC